MMETKEGLSGCSGPKIAFNALTNLDVDDHPHVRDRNLFVKQWREIVNIFGSKVISNHDWSTCYGGYLVLQLESRFLPDHDLLLTGYYRLRPVPLILQSNGALIAYGLPEPSMLSDAKSLPIKIRLNSCYSLSFGTRISLLNGTRASDTRYRYPSASKHGDVVCLSGVFRLRIPGTTVIRPDINEILVGRLPITYYPSFEQTFLVSVINRASPDHWYTITIKPNGCLMLNLDNNRDECGLGKMTSISSLDWLSTAHISLDGVHFTAFNTLAPLSLNLPCDYVRATLKHSPSWRALSPIQAFSNCRLVTISGTVVTRRVPLAVPTWTKDTGADMFISKFGERLISVFPPRLRPRITSRFTVPIYNTTLGQWSYGRLKLRSDGKLVYLGPLGNKRVLHHTFSDHDIQVFCNFMYMLC